jgi:hypothetical protein
MQIASVLRFPNPLPTTLAGRFAMLFSLIVQTVAMRYHRTRREPVALLLVPYLLRTAQRLERLIEAAATGAPRSAPTRRKRPRPGRRAGAPPIALPTRYGWLLADLGHDIATWRNRLETQLATEEAKAFLAAAPTAGRLLRPLCRMLALRPAILYPPKPPPEPRPEPAAAREPAPAAPPWPRIRAIDDLPCPGLATRWPFHHLLAKNRP